MIKRKKIIVLVSVLFFICISYILLQFNTANNIKESCFESSLNKVLKKGDSLKLDKIYNFSKIFNCKNWNEVIIVGGSNASSVAIFLKEGIALPKINYSKRLKGSLLFYFIKDGKLISQPISLWQPGFLYFKDFNNFDYINLKKKDAIFKCVELETIGSEKMMLTFELTGNGTEYSLF
jgi:hypothetical protein